MERVIAESIANSVFCALKKAIKLSGLKKTGDFFDFSFVQNETESGEKLFAVLKVAAEGVDKIKLGMFLQGFSDLLERESIKTVLEKSENNFNVYIYKPSKVVNSKIEGALKLKINGEEQRIVCRKKPKKVYKHKIKVRFRDLDAMGHVSNNVFLVYLEEARVGFRDFVAGNRKGTTNFMSVVASHNIEYFAPIFLGEELEVEVFISHLTEKSYRFNHTIINRKTKQLKAVAFTQMVGYDYRKQIVSPLPEDYIIQLKDFTV